MIKTFKHKGLKKYFLSGESSGIQQAHSKRIRSLLARLNASSSAEDMDLPGMGLHKLRGELKEFYSIKVSGNWRIIFRFDDKAVMDVDYLDYH